MHQVDWAETTFGEIIEIYDHKRIPVNSRDRSKRHGPYPYYGASGIVDCIDDYIFDGRYLLVAEDGENLNSRQTPVAFFATGKFWVNNHAHIIKAIPSLADDYFLMAYLANSNISGYITGAAQPKLSQANLKAIKILLPPLQTQRKISAILSAYDNLIENNTRRIKILEEMAQAIYREWFVHFRFPGHEGVKMVETEMGVVPEGWDVKKLGEIAQDIRRNIQPDSIEEETPYIGLEHMPRKSIALSEWGKASDVKSTKLVFKKGEILFGKIRPYFHKVGVAPVDGVCSSDIIVLRSGSPEYQSITLACVSSVPFVEHATITSQGTKMPRASWEVLVNYQVAIPPQPLISYYNGITTHIVDLIINLIFQNRNLSRTRDILLPKLISGELDVSEVEVGSTVHE